VTPTAQHPIPTAPGALPLAGHAIPLLRDTLGFMESLRSHGDMVTIHLGAQPTVVLNSPALLKEILVDRAPSLDKGRFFDKMGQILGDGMVSAAGAAHIRKRRLLQPAFHRAQIEKYVGHMRERAEDAVAGWAPGEVLDVPAVMTGLTLDMLAATVFSSSLDESAFAELRRCLPVVMSSVGRRIMSPDLLEKLPTPGNRRFNEARRRVRAIIGDAVERLRAGGHDEDDMLAALLRARDEETGEPMTAERICNEILTLAVAGTETSALCLSWLFYELARHPEAEKQVVAEVDDVLGGRPVGFEEIGRLEYTRRVVTETLRLHHPGWLVTRRTTTRTTIGGREFPPGTDLAYCQYALHRDAALFPDPLRFDPDRWLDDWAATLPEGAFIPFGAGKHKCIGEHYAWTQLIVTVATVVSRRRLTTAAGQVVTPVARATVRPKQLLMTVGPRTARA
jgi:cytochrome P450